METTGTCLTHLGKEEINQLDSAILHGVKGLQPSIGVGPTIMWPYLENEVVKLIPGTQKGDFINIEIRGNVITPINTPINKKFLIIKN